MNPKLFETIASRLCEKGASFAVQSMTGLNPLHHAIRSASADVLEICCEKAPVEAMDAADFDGQTPLNAAVEASATHQKFSSAAILMIKKGAAVTKKYIIGDGVKVDRRVREAARENSPFFKLYNPLIHYLCRGDGTKATSWLQLKKDSGSPTDSREDALIRNALNATNLDDDAQDEENELSTHELDSRPDAREREDESVPVPSPNPVRSILLPRITIKWCEQASPFDRLRFKHILGRLADGDWSYALSKRLKGTCSHSRTLTLLKPDHTYIYTYIYTYKHLVYREIL